MAQLTIDEAVLRALQQRAEQMARGELCELGACAACANAPSSPAARSTS